MSQRGRLLPFFFSPHHSHICLLIPTNNQVLCVPLLPVPQQLLNTHLIRKQKSGTTLEVHSCGFYDLLDQPTAIYGSSSLQFNGFEATIFSSNHHLPRELLFLFLFLECFRVLIFVSEYLNFDLVPKNGPSIK